MENKQFNKKVIWHFAELSDLIFTLVLFPFWIREVTYHKIKSNSNKSKLKSNHLEEGERIFFISKKLKMDRDKFFKMDQLDRIEYFLQRAELKDRYEGSIAFSFLNAFVLLLGYMLILALLLYIAVDSLVLFRIFNPLITIFAYAFVASVISDVILRVIYFRRVKRLNKFFLEKKGGKN